MQKKPKVLIIFGDASETVDTMYPYFRLIEGGYDPGMAAPEKREYQMVMHQVKPGRTISREWEGYAMPARADCVRGRRMATVPKCKFDLEVCGGTFVDEPCVIDGNLVSGRTFWDHGHYMGPWMKLLDGVRTSQET